MGLMLELIFNLIYNGDIETAVEIACEISASENRHNEISEFLSEIAIEIILEGKAENALILFDAAINMAKDDILIKKILVSKTIAYYDLAKKCYDAKNFEKALIYYKKINEITPNNALNHSIWADSLSELDRFEEAKEHFKISLDLDPNDATINFNYAVFLHKINKEQKAIKHYRKAIELEPNNPLYYVNYGNILSKQNKITEAEYLFKISLTLDPNFTYANFNYASLLIQKEEYNEAEKHLNKVMEIDDNFEQLHFMFGILYEKMQDYERSKMHYFDELKIHENNEANNNNYARILILLNQKKESKKYLLKAIELNEESIANIFYAEIIRDDEGKNEEALIIFEKFIKKGYGKEDKNFILLSYASTLSNLKRYDEAEKYFKKVFDYDSEIPELNNNFGLLLNRTKKFAESIFYFEKAISLNYELSEAHFNYGLSLIQLGEYEKSDDEFNIAENQGFSKGHILGEKGFKYAFIVKNKDYKRSLDYFYKAKEWFLNNNYSILVSKIDGYINLINGIRCWSINDFLNTLNYFTISYNIFKKIFEKEIFTWLKFVISYIEIENIFREMIDDDSINGIIKKTNDIMTLNDNFKKLMTKNGFEDDLLQNNIKFYEIFCDIMNHNSININDFTILKDVYIKYSFANAFSSVTNLEYFYIKYKEFNCIDILNHEEEMYLLSLIKNIGINDNSILFDKNNECIMETKYDYGSSMITLIKKMDVEYVKIEERKYDWVRVGSAQLNILLNDEYPYYLKNQNDVINKIDKVIQLAILNNVNILCFPELTMNFKNTNSIKEMLNKICQNSENMIIIMGSYYKSDENICPIIIDKRIYKNVKKITPSLDEFPPLGYMKQGRNPVIYSTKYGIFSVLICKDLEKEAQKVIDIARSKKIDLQMIFIPEYNPKWKRYEKIAESIARDNSIYIVLANRSEINDNFGRTSIYGKTHRKVLDALKEKQLKRVDSEEYLIAEIGDMEGILIADINVKMRNPPIPQGPDRPPSNVGHIFIVELKNN